MPTDNHTQDPALVELKRHELLQAFEIANSLARQALTKRQITASDVDQAISYNRESSEKLGKLRLALLGVEVE